MWVISCAAVSSSTSWLVQQPQFHRNRIRLYQGQALLQPIGRLTDHQLVQWDNLSKTHAPKEKRIQTAGSSGHASNDASTGSSSHEVPPFRKTSRGRSASAVFSSPSRTPTSNVGCRHGWRWPLIRLGGWSNALA